MRHSLSLVAVLVLLAGGAVEAKAGVLYGSVAFPPRQLLTINTATGAGAAVGPFGPFTVSGLAFDPNTNTLYGAGFGELLTINTSTGAATVVGPLGFGNVLGLAFDPNTNTLFGSEFANDFLLTINTATGAGTPVGVIGTSFGVEGLAFDPNTNTLYGTAFASNQLLTINTATGAGAAVGPLGFFTVGGLAFDPVSNTLFGIHRPSNQLLTINTATGAGTAVGPVGFSDVHGLAFSVPEPFVVDIDIKPASDPNSINLRSNGVLPVAIFSTNDFDALLVVEETILFGDPELVGGEEPVGLPASPIRSVVEDVDGDGLDDLLLFFSVPELDVLASLDELSDLALLIGQTFDGISIEGLDSVRIVPPKGRGKSGQ